MEDRQAKSLEYKCPSCGGGLEFDSQSQGMKCPFCGSGFSTEQLDELYGHHENREASEEDWQQYDEHTIDDCTVYMCPSCGAKIITDELTMATKCVYCGNPAINKQRASGVIKPDYVIPFKLNREYAMKALKDFYKKKPLLPSNFASDNNINEVVGLYVPFWLYDCGVSGSIRYRATRVHTWSDSEYNYTKTDYYAITRGGSLAFSKLPADGSSKMDDSYMDAVEPFDYSELEKFSTTFLSGYFADRYDVSSKDNLPRINRRVIKSTQDAFLSTVVGYSGVSLESSDLRVDNGSIVYAMMPVWVLNTKYNEKNYMFVMNGQSGKMVGKLPVSMGKLFAWLFGIAAGVAAVAQLILLFM